MKRAIQYTFEPVTHCNMCQTKADEVKILGQRPNTSVGKSPKEVKGISTTVVRCKNCGLIYSTPLAIPLDIQDHYGVPPEDYWKDAYFDFNENYFKSEIEKAKELLDFQPGMKALDIGAGLGKAMKALENVGFASFGFEPSETFRQMALKKMGFEEERLRLGMIEELDYPEASFDFITFGAVLEHLYDPAACIEKALKWLKPGGVIHIEVPSSDWFIPKLLDRYYRFRGTNYTTHLSPMHPPYHLYEFTTNSFKALAKRLGFEIAFAEYFVCPIYHIPKFLHGPLRSYMRRTDKGMQLSIWLRKP